jgi:hypothetical protein
MLKIIITETGQKELTKLNFVVEESLDQIIAFIPKLDLIGLGHIFITDKPNQSRKSSADATAAYFQKYENTSAYVEIYLARLYSHVKSAESFSLMIPLQMVGLAEALFHEVGHHVEKTRSHGIKKKTREKFAEKYANELLSKYLADNAQSIDACFENSEIFSKWQVRIKSIKVALNPAGNPILDRKAF